MSIIIKIILILLFLGCLFDMPYGYYQLVRFAGFLGFGLLAYQCQQQNQERATLAYISLALLLQPFIKVALGRTIWNIVDIIVAIFLLISIVTNRRRATKQ